MAGPSDHATTEQAHTAPWWKVMCLTGVDYFSTLGYQPSIAFVAAGALSPIATLVLVLLTLCGALPVYGRIAQLSPHGQGSLAVLEDKLPKWRGKAFVLCLLGFAATDFVITITLSAADATQHIVQNPFVPHWLDHQILVTLVLVSALGAIFLKGFREAIGIAVVLVAAYIAMNIAIVGLELAAVWRSGSALTIWWQHALAQIDAFRSELAGNATLPGWWVHLLLRQSNLVLIGGLSLFYFPKLALGMSGFETGVAVMPLVAGSGVNEEDILRSRIRNTRKLLATAAAVMSVLLIGSALVTATRIPEALLQSGGEANGRALAYLAHRDFGEWFGTAYDALTIGILWFAGASAMAGLLNLVPRYLPRYGMAPEWAGASRPLVLLITAVGVVVTLIFGADVDAQGGAYATGVLVLMTSAAVAVTLAQTRHRWMFAAVAVIFVYTTVLNMIERPEGLKIATCFILAIIATSLVSRVLRSTEIRIKGIDYDEKALEFIRDAAGRRSLRIIASRPNAGSVDEYARKLQEARQAHQLPSKDAVLFLEIRPGDASTFSEALHVRGVDVGGYKILRSRSPAIPNAIAGLLLDLRDRTYAVPHAYFGWTEGNPIAYLLKFLAFGEGDTAPVCREVLRQAEPDPERRPRIHVG